MAKIQGFDPNTEKQKHPEIIIQVNRVTGDILGIFKGARVAYNHTGVPPHSIHNCCTGRSRTAYGYVWKFVTPQSYFHLTGETLTEDQITKE